MATERITNVPEVRLTGKRIGHNNTTATNVNGLKARTKQAKTTDKEFRNDSPYMFSGSVTVEMSVTGGLRQKNYAAHTDADRNRIGELQDSSNKDLAEIRYTLNGKDPSTTKFTRYSAPFSIKQGTNHTKDGARLKSRVYHQGRWGPVVEVMLNIV